MADLPTEFDVPGGVIKRYRRLLTAVDGEYVITPTADGFETALVDPANVMMGTFSVDLGVTTTVPENFESLGEFAVPDSALRRAIDPASKGRGNSTGDPVTFSIDRFRSEDSDEPYRVTASVEPEREEFTIEHNYTFATIDPDSVRNQPDVPNLDLPATIRVSRKAFTEGLSAVVGNSGSSHLTIREDDGDLVFETQTDTDSQEAVIHDVVDNPSGEEASSFFSADYIHEVLKAFRETKPERTTITLGHEFPAKFSAEWPDLGIEATYMVAPRIQSD
jgi:hypothetical protein